jgi:hypothetical protein
VYGVSIASEVPLPLPEVVVPIQPPLFKIEIRALPRREETLVSSDLQAQCTASSAFAYGQFADGSNYVRWSNVGEARISKDGCSIICHPLDGGASESLHVYLLGQALSFALVKNGFEPLHATAVVVDNRAVVFLGNCGSGKSTLAGAFVRAGYRLLTDDLLLLQNTSRGFLAYPGAPCIKLFPEMARTFITDTGEAVTMNSNTEKLIIRLENSVACPQAIPLTAIYDLRSKTTGDTVTIAALSKKEAFLCLLSSAFNYFIDDSSRLCRQFDFARSIVSATGVKALCYPRVVDHVSAVVRSILSDILSSEP